MKNRRYYLCPGPETPERLTAAKEEYDELVRRLKGRSADPRVEEISRVLAERPEWIDVVRAVLGVREDVAAFGQSIKWFELVRERVEVLVADVREATESSSRLEVGHPNPTPAVSSPAESDTSVDELKLSIKGYRSFDEEDRDIADRLAVTAALVGLSGEQINNAFMNFLIDYSDQPSDEGNAILADPERVKALGAYRNPVLGPPKTPPATPAATAVSD